MTVRPDSNASTDSALVLKREVLAFTGSVRQPSQLVLVKVVNAPRPGLSMASEYMTVLSRKCAKDCVQ